MEIHWDFAIVVRYIKVRYYRNHTKNRKSNLNFKNSVLIKGKDNTES